MAQVAETVRTWEPVPTDENDRVWEPVPTGKERAWEAVPAKKGENPPDVGLTPAEIQADEAANATPSNKAEIARTANDPRFVDPAQRAVVEQEQARIAAQPSPKPGEASVPSGGTAIDTSRPIINNPDGSFSTEKTITIEADGKHHVIPTIVGGRERTPDEAIKLFMGGQNPAVGTFATAQEAEGYAKQRSTDIGKVRAQLPRPTLHLPQRTPRPTAFSTPKPPAATAPPVAPQRVLQPPARELSPTDTALGFAFSDFIPGAIEGQVAGGLNAITGTAAAIPALVGAIPGGDGKSGDFIDRFRELHGDIAGKMEVKPETATGERSLALQSELIEAGLDAVGGAVAKIAGPETGAWVKGSLAALAAIAGVKGLAGKPKAPIERVNEPTFDPLTSVESSNLGRREPNVLQFPGQPREGRTEPRVPAGNVEILGGRQEPTISTLPEAPLARIEKPRIRLTPDQVRGRSIEEVSTPPGSFPTAVEAKTTPTEPKTRIVPDAVLDKAVSVDLFSDMFKIGGAQQPRARAEPPPPADVPSRAAERQDELPPAPGGVTRTEDKLGFVTPNEDTEYTAVHTMPSDVREGGATGGKQFVKLPQNLFWKGPTGKLDRALFVAGKAYRDEGPKAGSFDALQEQLRYLMFEDRSVSEAAKAPYRQFLTDDGSQVSRDKLMRGAIGYNVRVSTMLNNARRANEGRGVAIEVPGWGGAPDMPTPEGSPSPARPTPTREGELPAAPTKPAAKKPSYGAAGINYETDTLLTAIRKLGGVADDAKFDITGEKKLKGSLTGLKQVFRKGGKGLDDMALQLADEGYIPPQAMADVDGGVQWLRDAIRAEADGDQKYYSARGDENARFSREQEKYGPGTMGANPLFDPATWKSALKTMAGALEKVTPKRGRQWMDAAQGAQPIALPALASSWSYARAVASAKWIAETDIYRKTDQATVTRDWRSSMQDAVRLDPKYAQGLTPPTTVREVIQQTELARRHAAKLEMQRELIASGMASPVPLQGYSQLASNLADTRNSAGRQLYILNEAKPILEQMVGAHDIAQQSLRNQGLLGAAEAINHASVGLIMYNPGFHAVTVAGRAAPFIVNKLGSNSILFKLAEGSRKLEDREYMYDLMKNKGYEPMRIRDSMEALGGQQGKIEKIFRENGLGKPYDFWRYVHNKVMVGTVNRIQMAAYLMKVDDLVKSGIPRDAAEVSAARFSNLLGGNLPKEEMNQLWHQILGGALFSRGYTSTVVRQTTRAIMQDKVLMAQLERRGYTPQMIEKAVDTHRAELGKALMLDYFVMQIVGNGLNYAMTDGVEDRYGEKRRHFSWDNKPKDKPLGTKPDKMDYLFPDRIYIGQAKNGNDLYMENPLRTTRDQMLFFMQGKEIAAGEKPRWISRKLGTLAGLGEDVTLGEQRGGRPMRDSLDVAANVGDRMTPLDFRSAAEAVRMSSFDYFKDALFNAVSDAKTSALKLGGLQPHEEATDPTAAAARKVTKEQNKVWAEAAEIRSHWPALGEKARAAAIKRLETIGPKAGIKEHTLEKYVSEQEATKGQRAKARKGEGLFEFP
jgi:hypothetical protein